MSSYPAEYPSPENSFPASEGSSMPQDSQEPPSMDLLPPPVVMEPAQEPYISVNGNSEPCNSGSLGSKNLSSGSEKTNRLGDINHILDERKRRRMISNRESARRSRMRKKGNLENSRNKVKRFRMENPELMNRLRLVWYHDQIVRRENDRLLSEAGVPTEIVGYTSSPSASAVVNFLFKDMQ